MMSYDCPHPVSRTYQYKKITKPLLERKRRARINRCLEELKDLMMDALETEGENINKLEKADILELTVRHLQRLQASRPSGLSTSGTPNEDVSAESRWKSGFGHCAAEACKFLASLPGESAERLAKHLASGLQAPGQFSKTSTKSDNSSETLTKLDRTACVIAPVGPVDSTGSHDIPEKRKTAQSYPPNRRDERLELSDRKTAQKIVLNPKTEVVNSPSAVQSQSKSKLDCLPNVDEDEEIDVENVDDSNDPMWRPW